MSAKKFIEISKSFFVDPDYKAGLEKKGLTSIDAVFNFKEGQNLAKSNMAGFRSRLKFEIDSPVTTLFLKRYNSTPMLRQLKNWINQRRRASLGISDFAPTEELACAGIRTPKVAGYGEQWSGLFEKRSFCITEKIPEAESLERKLPEYFSAPPTASNLRLRRDFICRVAAFIKKFHETGFRHRDLYLCHLFCTNREEFYLIDLTRVFKPCLFAERFRIKDITQFYYSAPANYFSDTDRLRFYLKLAGKDRLCEKDKRIILKIKNKAKRMAKHDLKLGRSAPFACKAG